MAESTRYKLKTDPQGMVGRECPSPGCAAYFKVEAQETDCDVLTCPLCGKSDDCKKYTTDEQIQYLNSLIFHKDACPINYSEKTKTPPCRDYVEVPARCVYLCGGCGKKFGLDDQKPGCCPYCGAGPENLHPEDKCEICGGKGEPA